MPKVELIYDQDCPNVTAARANLMKALTRANLTAKWQEWDRKSSDSPHYVRRYGSPSILIDGVDVGGSEPGTENASCRVYLDSTEPNKHVPSVEMIVGTLSRSAREFNSGKSAGIFGGLAIGPSAGAAILAKAACPLCYPAIAALFSSLSLGFLFKGTYFAILAALLLGVVLFGLGYRAPSRRGFGPLFLGLVSAIGVFVATVVWDQTTILYIGVVGLVAASIWNLIPRKRSIYDSCPSCVTDGAQSIGAQGE